SLPSWAPTFSKVSSRGVKSRAIDTPSLVTMGTPYLGSRITLRPRGPRVTLTASAILLVPASRARRASSLNLRSLDMRDLLPDDGEDVAAGEDQHVFALDRDLGAAVLAVDDDVAGGDVHGDELAGDLRATAGAYGQQ